MTCPQSGRQSLHRIPGVPFLAGALATAWVGSLARGPHRVPSTEGTGTPRCNGMRTCSGQEVRCSRVPRTHQSHAAVPALGTQGGKGEGAQWSLLSARVLGCLQSDCMNASGIWSRSLPGHFLSSQCRQTCGPATLLCGTWSFSISVCSASADPQPVCWPSRWMPL